MMNMHGMNDGKKPASSSGGVIEPEIRGPKMKSGLTGDGGMSSAAGLSALKSQYKTTSSLNPDGMTFKENLIKKLKESTYEGTSVPVMGKEPITATIPQVGEVLYLTGDNNNTFVIIFKTGFNQSFEPPTRHLNKVAEKLHEYHPECVLFNVLLVDPDSYSRLESTYMYVYNCFVNTKKGAVRLTLSNVASQHDFKDKTIILDTNIHSVRRALDEMNSPTTVSPRVDYGCVIKYVTKSNRYGEADDLDNADTLAVIGAFTDFIEQGSPTPGRPSIIPMVTITTIESPFLQRELLAMYIPIAVQEFLNQYQWLGPYTKFTNSDVSLAPLVNDPTFTVQSMTDVQEIVQYVLTKPELAIEVSIGRPMLPGIASLVYDEQGLYKVLTEFIGETDVETARLCTRKVSEFTGVLLTQGDPPMDTKCVDYLALAQSMRNEDTLDLLKRYTDPRVRVSMLRKLYGDDAVDIRYDSTICILDPVVVKNLGRIVLPALGITSIGGGKNNHLGFAGLGLGSYETLPHAGSHQVDIHNTSLLYNF